jgi:hypothetical protein
LPPIDLARNLEAASNRQVVHVDGKGRVRSPARFRAIQYGSSTVLGGVVAFATVLYAQMIGPAGAIVGVALGGWVAYLVSLSLGLRRGLRHFVADHVDEAADIYARVAHRPLVPRKVRALAEQNLASCRTMQGRHEEALQLFRSAAVRWGRSRKVFPMLARYGEVFALIHVGQVPEARSRWAAIGAAPDGDFLLVHHWGAELYLALAEGDHQLAHDELHRRARSALAITSAGGLLGLLGWAFARLGDRDMSCHLLSEALDRHPGARLSGGMPLLQKWLDEAAAAPA